MEKTVKRRLDLVPSRLAQQKKKKRGRPRGTHIPINWEEFDKLCAIQCTETEIAAWFQCSVDTIWRAVKREHKRTFEEYYEEKSSGGRIALRRMQFQVANRGDTGMMIWLGKQYLDQKDKKEMGGLNGQPLINIQNVQVMDERARLTRQKMLDELECPETGTQSPPL
jgi:hypothetical protein